MKIVIIAYWHDPRFKKKPGGLIRMFELADNLMGLGHHVTMILPKLGFPSTQTHARVVAVPFCDLPLLRPLSYHLLSCIQILLIFLKKIDRIYVRQMNSFLPLLMAKVFGVFSYFEIPNDPYLGYSLVDHKKRWVIKIIDRLCMRLADRIIVLSEWSKLRLKTIGGISPDKIFVFPSGTDTELFNPIKKNEACLKLGFDSSCKYVGFIGSFLEYQGIDTLIDAAPIIVARYPNTRFILVGDGPMRIAWEKKIQEKGLQNHFIFTGHVPYRDVPNYIGVMDICVAPHHQETNQASPVKLFDYMASGRPIVASDIEVVREIIADSGCAILIPPQQPQYLATGIISLLENDSQSTEMADRGRKYAVKLYDRKNLTKDVFNRQ